MVAIGSAHLHSIEGGAVPLIEVKLFDFRMNEETSRQ